VSRRSRSRWRWRSRGRGPRGCGGARRRACRRRAGARRPRCARWDRLPATRRRPSEAPRCRSAERNRARSMRRASGTRAEGGTSSLGRRGLGLASIGPTRQLGVGRLRGRSAGWPRRPVALEVSVSRHPLEVSDTSCPFRGVLRGVSTRQEPRLISEWRRARSVGHLWARCLCGEVVSCGGVCRQTPRSAIDTSKCHLAAVGAAERWGGLGLSEGACPDVPRRSTSRNSRVSPAPSAWAHEVSRTRCPPMSARGVRHLVNGHLVASSSG
jgi:hypothetical protein